MTEQKARPLGEWLQHRREELDISLEQAEEDTRIRIRYLEALEAGDFDALPDPIVGRGFLRNYAAYLELDPAEIARYADSIAPPAPELLPAKAPAPAELDAFRPVPLHDISSRISRQSLGLALLAILILVAFGAAIYFAYPLIADLLGQDDSASRPTLVPTFTRQATSVALSTATHTATSEPVVIESAPTATTETDPIQTPTLEVTIRPSFTPSPSPSPSPPIYTGIFLEVVFTDTSWIQVTVDGVREFQGELDTGTYRSWFGEERIELRVGNAGAVQVTVNGQFLGPLGAVGEVVDRVFEKVDDGIIESTATPEVTGTLTVEPSATPTVAPPTTTVAPAPPITPTVPITPTTTITPTLTITPTASP